MPINLWYYHFKMKGCVISDQKRFQKDSLDTVGFRTYGGRSRVLNQKMTFGVLNVPKVSQCTERAMLQLFPEDLAHQCNRTTSLLLGELLYSPGYKQTQAPLKWVKELPNTDIRMLRTFYFSIKWLACKLQFSTSPSWLFVTLTFSSENFSNFSYQWVR